ncbi:MAG: DUF1385 domain-containing protein [Roseburia sp.]
MTTKEPDDEMIEVGIASVEAVFDWKPYVRRNPLGNEVEGREIRYDISGSHCPWRKQCLKAVAYCRCRK